MRQSATIKDCREALQGIEEQRRALEATWDGGVAVLELWESWGGWTATASRQDQEEDEEGDDPTRHMLMLERFTSTIEREVPWAPGYGTEDVSELHLEADIEDLQWEALCARIAPYIEDGAYDTMVDRLRA